MQTKQGGKFPTRTRAEPAKEERTRDTGREGNNLGRRGQREGCGSRMRSSVRFRGLGEAGCAVQGAREIGGARRVRSSWPTLAAGLGESKQLSGAPDTPGLVKVTGLEHR